MNPGQLPVSFWDPVYPRTETNPQAGDSREPSSEGGLILKGNYND